MKKSKSAKYAVIEIDDVVGIDWIRALRDVATLRVQRANIYGNGWLHEPIQYDLWTIYGKATRLKNMLEHGNNNYERVEDTCKDIVNYCLFALAKLNKSKSRRKKQ